METLREQHWLPPGDAPDARSRSVSLWEKTRYRYANVANAALTPVAYGGKTPHARWIHRNALPL
ncbi:MAG: hypothetical protein PUP91_11915 [Rhizonema sp. PD37]|nr:hypothetical protein [Rhizonema sp. PD37]